jgi:hypothetical protein
MPINSSFINSRLISRRFIRPLALLCSIVLFPGCSLLTSTYVRPAGQVGTRGLTIRAADGSFTLSDGAPFAPAGYVGADSVSCGYQGRDLAPGDYSRALRSGAHRVIVHHPAHGRPLHGVLMFCTVWDGDQTGATRFYDVDVPASAIRDVDRGVSLTFVRAQYPSSEYHQVQWALWLSEAEI